MPGRGLQEAVSRIARAGGRGRLDLSDLGLSDADLVRLGVESLGALTAGNDSLRWPHVDEDDGPILGRCEDRLTR
jgi:hypothetical protein